MATQKRSASKRAVTINEKAALDRVMKLMAVPGKSGEEFAVSECIRKALLSAGAKKSQLSYDTAHKKSPDGGNCGNLILKLPGTIKAPRRLFSAHTDTVPLCVGSKPVRKGGKIVAKENTALGADDRAGCAALLTAATEILQRKLPHPPLTFLWAVQEETGMHGVQGAALSKLGKPELAFNWDGGEPSNITIGATGAYKMIIRIRGIASHAGGRPEEGVSAAAVFGLAMAELQEGGWHGLIMKGGKRGTSNIGVVRGGEATNVVMDEMEVVAEARAHDKGLRKRILEAYLKAFVRAAKKVKNTAGNCAGIEFEANPKYEAFKLSMKDPSVVAAVEGVRALGMGPQFGVANGGLDANWLTARGIPAVTLGMGQGGAHTVKESLAIRKYLMGCRLALKLATTA